MFSAKCLKVCSALANWPIVVLKNGIFKGRNVLFFYLSSFLLITKEF